MKTAGFAAKLARKARLAWLDRISELIGCEQEMWESFCESAGTAATTKPNTGATRTCCTSETPRK